MRPAAERVFHLSHLSVNAALLTGTSLALWQDREATDHCFDITVMSFKREGDDKSQLNILKVRVYCKGSYFVYLMRTKLKSVVY